MKRILLLCLLSLLPMSSWSESYSNWSTTNVSQDDGDTIATSQATASCTTGCVGTASLLSAAITNRGNRRRTFCNGSGFALFLGTAAVNSALLTTGFRVSESTGTYPCYSTYSTAAIYGQSIGTSSATVTVIQEKVAMP